MRILLDECVDESLRHHFGSHDCQTCRYAGLCGVSNGKLLAAAERDGFEVLVTVDQNMPYQQRLSGRAIKLVVLSARTTILEDLVALIPEVLDALKDSSQGATIRVGMR
ncbi:MAG TPA: DUF5615 family PIN-like protein [Bryobacteraceae bacterium]|jgi:predicted nuclease of predicted toxin-antitoxin system